MSRIRRWWVAGALVLLAGTVACSGDTSKAAGDPYTESEGVDVGVLLIDVRTAEEFATGHLDGAVNYDFESGAFLTALADLDPKAGYALYCRSGRRSALATELMRKNGFPDVVDLGSLEDASTTLGRAIVS